MGGTALAVHLRHRLSRDLDVFTTEQFDAQALEKALKVRGRFAATLIGSDTLNGVFEGAKIQFLRTTGQTVLAPTTRVAGMNVGSIDDIFATKVKVIGYFDDLMDDPFLEDEHGPHLKERVIEYWQRRQPQIMSSFDPYSA